MIELEFGPADLAFTRFAISPLWEVVASVLVLQRVQDNDMHGPWIARVRPRLASADLQLGVLIDLVAGRPGIPGFVSPPPATPVPDIEIELAGLAASPLDRIRDELAESAGSVDKLPPRLRVFHNEPAEGLAALVKAVRTYWDVALAPYWPRIRSVLEGDVLYRARGLADGGIRQVLSDLDASVVWDADTLYVSHRRCSRGVELAGRGLLLVPSVFVWPRVFSIVDAPWQPTLRYPPRGVGTLWERRPASASEAVAGVLGRSRALLLAELADPASTGELAHRTGLTRGRCLPAPDGDARGRAGERPSDGPLRAVCPNKSRRGPLGRHEGAMIRTMGWSRRRAFMSLPICAGHFPRCCARRDRTVTATRLAVATV